MVVRRTAWGMVAMALLVSCGEEATEPAVQVPPPPPPELVARIHPALHLDTPLRGTFETGEVMVSGGTAPGTAPLSSLTVAGVEVPIDAEGRFSTTVPLEPGPNIIEVRLDAEDQGRAVDAVTVFGGPVRPPGETIDDALFIHLGQEFLDDDDPDLDDIAALTEVTLMDHDFVESFLGAPLELEGQTLTVNTVTYSPVAVDLRPAEPCLTGTIVLGESDPAVGGAFHLEMVVSGSASLFGDLVIVHASSVTVGMALCPARGPTGELTFEGRDAVVSFDGFVASTSEFPDFGEDFPSVNATLQTLIEDKMAAWIGDNLGGMIGDFLESFELDTTVGLLRTVINLEDVVVNATGVDMALSASFASDLGLLRPPVGPGSLVTDDSPLPYGFSTAPVALALSDDAINQLLFAFWYSGAIGDYEVPEESLTELPEVFQPLSDIQVELRLPPTLLAPTEPEFPFDLGSGGVRLQILAGTDRHFDAGLHIRTGVSLTVADGSMSMSMDDRAQRITVKANVAEAPSVLDPGDVAALFRMMVPAILGQANVTYDGYPLPDLDLSRFAGVVSALEGRTLRFVPSGSSKMGTGGGYLVVAGAMVEP